MLKQLNIVCLTLLAGPATYVCLQPCHQCSNLPQTCDTIPASDPPRGLLFDLQNTKDA